MIEPCRDPALQRYVTRTPLKTSLLGNRKLRAGERLMTKLTVAPGMIQGLALGFLTVYRPRRSLTIVAFEIETIPGVRLNCSTQPSTGTRPVLVMVNVP